MAALTFENLAYGYYYVTSTMGSVITIDNTMKNVTIEDKNEEPSVEKAVLNATANEADYEESTTASIGDKVKFQITIRAKKGAVNYVLHDVMDAGLDLVASSISVTGLTAAADYTVSTSAADACDFEIAFTESYLNSLIADTDIVVTYEATLNGEATVVSIDNNVSNNNKTHLDYGDAQTVEAEAVVYTYSFDLIKTGPESGTAANAYPS